MVSSTPGAILHPHPPPWESEVNRGSRASTEWDVICVQAPQRAVIPSYATATRFFELLKPSMR
jgi:hypothetical protein